MDGLVGIKTHVRVSCSSPSEGIQRGKDPFFCPTISTLWHEARGLPISDGSRRIGISVVILDSNDN